LLLKFTKVLIIVTEILLLVAIVSGFVRGLFPTNMVFWIAVVVEIFLGYLAYLMQKNALVNKNVRKWNLLGFGLVVLAITIPTILYYNVEYLKPTGSAWIFCLLSLNTFDVYRIIKKQPISRNDIAPGRFLTASKVLYWVALSGIAGIALVAIIYTIVGTTPVFSKEPALQVIFAIVCLPFLGLGSLVHRIVNSIWKRERSELFTYLIYSTQISIYITAAVLGLISGILDGLFYVSMPIILLAGLLVFLNYPNASRWEKWKTGVKV
jgi:hypothetical protein